jgi:superfamily II DNA or RNA helicase
MLLVKESPTKLRILEHDESDIVRLTKILSYKKKDVQHSISRMKKSKYFLVSRMGEEDFQLEMDRLTKEVNGTVLFEDESGYYTLTGLVGKIQVLMQNVGYRDDVVYPEFKIMPWDKVPEKKMRYYQKDAVEILLKNSHSHVEIGTGAGKSLIIMNLIKEIGLPTVIVTPSASIGRQLYDEALVLFGKKNVGLFGDGKRDLGKRILVSIAKSVAMVEDPEELEAFKKYTACIIDESHTVPSELLSKSALTTLAHCPYRWFLSATQERNDGKDILLEGIIGPLVYEKGIKELQDEGFLAKLSTLIFDVNSSSSYKGSNQVLSNQKHIYQNKNIISTIGTVVRQSIEANMPVLILIDELSQEELLLKELGPIYAFAHGKSDTKKAVDDFNSGKVMVLVGTSAVSTGTDIRSNQVSISWKANRSSVQVKQGIIGRSTRLSEGKTECKLIDFRVQNVDSLRRHCDARVEYYLEVGPVEFLDIT